MGGVGKKLVAKTWMLRNMMGGFGKKLRN
jgi:hypothetical protein